MKKKFIIECSVEGHVVVFMSCVRVDSRLLVSGHPIMDTTFGYQEILLMIMY